MTAPERIWITYEISLWPTFRTFHASSLDHSEAGDGYPEYVRADLVLALVDAAREAVKDSDENGRQMICHWTDDLRAALEAFKGYTP